MSKSQYELEEYYFNHLNLSLTEVLFCGQQQCIPGQSFGPAIRTMYLIVYIHSGEGTFKTQNTIYHLGGGSSFVIFPGEVTYYQADNKNPWLYSWVAFDSAPGSNDISQLLIRASITRRHPIHIPESSGCLDELFRNLIDFCRNKKIVPEIKVVSLFLDILYQYITTGNCMDSLRDISVPLSGYLDLAIEYIKAHYDQNGSVSDVAHYLGISREYFCNLFKKQFGISPIKFIRNYRLSVSSTLLKTSDLSISDIAYKVGYNDYNYYSACFSRYYGASPSQYRKIFLSGKKLPDTFGKGLNHKHGKM